MYKSIVILLLFLLGFYFIYRSNDIEAFTRTQSLGNNANGNGKGDNSDEEYKVAENCPDILIQKGSEFFLYNSKRASIPGVNPIRFDNLEDYTEFTEWQRSQGILCPILFLQHSYNAQGESVYKARPGPTNQQGGLPDMYITQQNLYPDYSTLPDFSSLNIIPPPNEDMTSKLLDAGRSTDYFNKNSFPGYDPQNQYIGVETPIDRIYNSDVHTKLSPNPMDHNWGGAEYTKTLVDAGQYKDREVRK